MNKRKNSVLVLLFAVVAATLVIPATPVWASGFNLKSIGEVETGGRPVRKWWYTSSSPIFRGEASPNAAITITIDETARQIYADSSGDWVFQASGLTEGEHTIALTTEGGQMSFTLVTGINNVDWDQISKGTGGETLPSAGNGWPTVTLPIIGLGMMWWARKWRVGQLKDQ
jgi:hypothetical protein